jgi:alpha-L-rhamnosidase
MQKNFPSWLYPVTQGATTIWERWDGWRHDRGFQSWSMNSFNHYAYGAVGHWMYQVVAGIRPDPEQPGFQHFILDPRPGGGLTHARAEYDSAYGKIISDWKLEGDEFVWKFTIPANTSAVVVRDTISHYEAGEYEIRTKLK